MNDKFPVTIMPSEEMERPFKAAISVGSLSDEKRNIRRDVCYVEADYTASITAVRAILAASSKAKGKDPRVFWLLGDSVLRFLERINEIGLYLAQRNATLGRDAGISETSMEKILAFRRRYPRLSMVDPTVSWAKYRDNKVQLRLSD
jgi:hypothetical protein